MSNPCSNEEEEEVSNSILLFFIVPNPIQRKENCLIQVLLCYLVVMVEIEIT
jgi:hypothetical protein